MALGAVLAYFAWWVMDNSGVQAPAVGSLLALGAVLAYFAWRVVGNSKVARYRSQREELLRRAAHAAGQ